MDFFLIGVGGDATSSAVETVRPSGWSITIVGTSRDGVADAFLTDDAVRRAGRKVDGRGRDRSTWKPGIVRGSVQVVVAVL